ncbi:MAG: permease prefix domain 1-containing protein [Planctomycetota bacterium]
MSEREFEAYLNLLARTLKLSKAQRDRIAGELRDHLEERMAELVDEGVDREDAILQALDEFGDANVLARNLTNHQKRKTMKQLVRIARPHQVVLSMLAIALMAALVYRVALYTPSLDINQTMANGHQESASSTTDPFEPIPQVLIEARIYDADPAFWNKLTQLSENDAKPTADVLLLNDDVAQSIAQHLEPEINITPIASPNMLVPFGENGNVLIGTSKLGDQPNHVHESGVGFAITPWWHTEIETLELAITLYTHRSFDSKTQQLITAAPPAHPDVTLESTTSRAWLQSGQAVAIRTAMNIPQHSGQHHDRVLLVMGNPMVLPNGERVTTKHRLLPPDIQTREDLAKLIAAETRWDRVRLDVLLERSGLEIEPLKEALVQQLDSRLKIWETLEPEANTSLSNPPVRKFTSVPQLDS